MDYALVEIIKTATKHFNEGKPWIKNISITNSNPTKIQIDFNEDQKVKFNNLVGTIMGITYSKGEVCYGFVADGWQDGMLVKADDIKEYVDT